jgi:hypothetical protein
MRDIDRVNIKSWSGTPPTSNKSGQAALPTAGKLHQDTLSQSTCQAHFLTILDTVMATYAENEQCVCIFAQWAA